MNIKINKHQLNLLEERFCIKNGILVENTNIICESGMKEFLVTIIIGGYFAKVRVFCSSSASAIQIVSKLFPNARVTAGVKSL